MLSLSTLPKLKETPIWVSPLLPHLPPLRPLLLHLQLQLLLRPLPLPSSLHRPRPCPLLLQHQLRPALSRHRPSRRSLVSEAWLLLRRWPPLQPLLLHLQLQLLLPLRKLRPCLPKHLLKLLLFPLRPPYRRLPRKLPMPKCLFLLRRHPKASTIPAIRKWTTC